MEKLDLMLGCPKAQLMVQVQVHLLFYMKEPMMLALYQHFQMMIDLHQ